MKNIIFLFTRIFPNIFKNIYIKGTVYSLKKLGAYFLILLILLVLSFFIDFKISLLILLTTFVSFYFFYKKIKSNGVFIELDSFLEGSNEHKVIEHIRIDELQESSRIVFYEKSPGVYWTHSKISLFPSQKNSHFSIIPGLIKQKNVQNVLLLGGGTDSISCAVAEQKSVKTIDSIELDKRMQTFGKKYFISLLSKENSKKILQITADAKKYVAISEKKYDFVIVDIFVDGELPSFIFSKKFLSNISQLLTKKGIVFFNFAGNEKQVRKNYLVFRKAFRQFYIYKYSKPYLNLIVGSNSRAVESSTDFDLYEI